MPTRLSAKWGKAHMAEDSIRELIHARYILLKKVIKALTRKIFGSESDAIGVGEELTLLRVLLDSCTETNRGACGVHWSRRASPDREVRQ